MSRRDVVDAMWSHRYRKVDTPLAAAVDRRYVCAAAILERSRSTRMCTERYRLHYKIDCNSLNSEPIFMKFVL